jgi:hypothetical protein
MDKSLEELVRNRARGCCEYCQMPQNCDSLSFQIDHIIALQHLGATASDNLALACYACNHRKGPNIAGFDHSSQQTVALYHPRRDRWAEHFRWQGPELIGLTPVGQVTIQVLAINHDYRIALRRTLIQEGVFPPIDSGSIRTT